MGSRYGLIMLLVHINQSIHLKLQYYGRQLWINHALHQSICKQCQCIICINHEAMEAARMGINHAFAPSI
jgi:hypothetical protein